MKTTTISRPICHRCGHALTTGNVYGGTCESKIHHALATVDLTDYTPKQVEQATELVEIGGVVAVGHLFLAMSSSGDVLYEVSERGACTCIAASYGRRCYHTAAAKIMAATTQEN